MANQIAQIFLQFSAQTAGSPMYEHLSRWVSEDEALLSLAAQADSKQPIPNLFFGAVQFLLMQQPQDLLAKYYPSLGGQFAPTAEMFDTFKSFCKKFESDIRQILATKLVQTNEVQRCALLLPAVHFVAQKSGQSKIALVDVGASGGLNFLMDKAHIQYTDGQVFGPPSSALQISCESKGSKIPTEQNIEITDRIGIDLNPVNLMDERALLWNLALIWPDQIGRVERFKSAIQVLRTTPINLESGSGNEVLPRVVANISSDSVLCVMHSFTLNQFSKEDRELFEGVLSSISKNRDLWRISLEWIGTTHPEVTVSDYKSGVKASQEKIAECSGHGEWIRWGTE